MNSKFNKNLILLMKESIFWHKPIQFRLVEDLTLDWQYFELLLLLLFFK